MTCPAEGALGPTCDTVPVPIDLTTIHRAYTANVNALKALNGVLQGGCTRTAAVYESP